MRNNIERYIKKKVKSNNGQSIMFRECTGGDNIGPVDFYSLIHSQFQRVPIYKEERRERLQQVLIFVL
jgi:hypothetical protein